MSLKPQCVSVQCVDLVVPELGALGCREGHRWCSYVVYGSELGSGRFVSVEY